MMNKRPTKAMSRGLTLVSKILQATVNQSSLSKEGGMAYFQSLINEQAEAVNKFVGSSVYFGNNHLASFHQLH